MDWPSLADWDEAWYASIARNMSETGQFMPSWWNDAPFYDHPPMGFWIMAVVYKIAGVSEFTTRLPSVLMGIASIIILYFVGIEFFKKKEVGFAAAMILGTSVWYVLRVRSGNLDSPFIFFYILTIFLALRSVKMIKLLPLVGVSLGALMMTKTIVGASIIPIIGLIMLRQIAKIKENYVWFLGGIATFLVMVVPWYWYHFTQFSNFYLVHFVRVGTRNKTAESFFQLQYTLPLFYLHMGVRKWYYLWQLSVGYLLLSLQARKNRTWIVIIWNLVVLYPFLTTDQTHIWHLIPVYLPLSLLTAYGLWDLGNMAATCAKKVLPSSWVKFKDFIFHTTTISTCYVLAILVIVGMQVKVFYPEVIPTSRYITDEVDISQRVTKYQNQHIYLDDDFLPIAVFYSERNIKQVSSEPDERKSLVGIFSSGENEFVAITRNWAVTNLDDNNLEYVILEKNNSFSIVARPGTL